MTDAVQRLSAALSGRYVVERELGAGGMATVYLAQDVRHDRKVALKVLRPELSAILGGERFLAEIKTTANLQHPHILSLFDSGDAGGALYYVMPYVEGESLRQRLERERQLPLEDALRIARDAGSALQYAHEHGVVHRDVKPENIMLSGAHAVVADFGIARALDSANAHTLTLSGMVIGTPQYMCPEQASGAAVDGRADQYSLACTLFEMLTGQPPFTGPSALAVMARHSVDPVPRLRVVRGAVPEAVEGAIVRAMAKSPADRFDSVQQFLDALEGQGAASAARSPHASWPRARRRVALALGIGLPVVAAAWFVAWPRLRGADPRPRAVRTVAVLPFQAVGDSGDGSYLAAGMTEGLIADLAQVGALRVISSYSASVAQGSARSLAGLASRLGVEAVVIGSIRRSGDSVRVRVRLVQTSDSSALFAEEYRGLLGALPDLQREITVAITGSIDAELRGTERSRLSARGSIDQRAYEAYLRGRFHLERGELERARAMFEEAGRIAPDWAPPLVGLANYYSTLPFFTDVPPAEVLPKARAALAHALELDETLAEAHTANGYIRAYYEWDWRAAELEFRRAIELRPNYADAYFSYSRFLASRRRFDEAIAQLGRAVDLDPLSALLQANRALLDYFAGRYELADTRLRAALESDSTDPTVRWGLALVAEQQGRPREAIALLEPISGASLNRRASLGHAYAVAGQGTRARSVLAALNAQAARSYVPAYYFALVHAGLGQRDQALHYLERAYDERSTVLAYLLIDPRLAALRDEPRFQALARRLEGT